MQSLLERRLFARDENTEGSCDLHVNFNLPTSLICRVAQSV
jgi:hypothetical protein